ELLAMPPEAVAEFLKRRARQPNDEARDDPVDEEAEQALRSRGHPLIDLALARYGRHISTVAALFQSTQWGHAIRLAALCNTSIALEIFKPFPVGLIGKEAAQAAQWIGE